MEGNGYIKKIREKRVVDPLYQSIKEGFERMLSVDAPPPKQKKSIALKLAQKLEKDMEKEFGDEKA